MYGLDVSHFTLHKYDIMFFHHIHMYHDFWLEISSMLLNLFQDNSHLLQNKFQVPRSIVIREAYGSRLSIFRIVICFWPSVGVVYTLLCIFCDVIAHGEHIPMGIDIYIG